MTAILAIMNTRFLPTTFSGKASMGSSKPTLSRVVDLLPKRHLSRLALFSGDYSYVSCPDPSVNTTYTLQYCSIIYSEDKVPSFLCPVGETYTPTSFRASQKKTQNWYLEVRLPLPLVNSHVQTLTDNTINLVCYVG